MCGVMGMVLREEQRSEAELEALRIKFGKLLVATQTRGQDATGAFVVNKKPQQNTSPLKYHKAQGSALKMYKTDSQFWGLMDTIGNDTLGAIGHTRFATKGCPTCNDNNHPIVMNKHIVGVHNGVLVNDEELKEMFPYQQEVDSAAIFSTMHALSAHKALTSEVIGDTLQMIHGDMAIGVADVRDPSKLFIARDDGRPLFLLENEDALWIASTPEILSTGLGLMKSKAEQLDAFSVMTFNGSRDNKEVMTW